MLAMRPDCQGCGRDLPAGSGDARICLFECTYCAACVDGPLAGICPRCGGTFERRPVRADALLERYPASMERKHSGDA